MDPGRTTVPRWYKCDQIPRLAIKISFVPWSVGHD